VPLIGGELGAVSIRVLALALAGDDAYLGSELRGAFCQRMGVEVGRRGLEREFSKARAQQALFIDREILITEEGYPALAD